MSLLIIAIAAFVVFYAVSKLFPMTLMAAIKVTSGRYEKLVVMVSGLKNGLQLLTPQAKKRGFGHTNFGSSWLITGPRASVCVLEAIRFRRKHAGKRR
jgi:hypothetical protein